jgi:hypothetical protein
MALLTTALVTVGLRPVQSLLSDLVAAKQRRRSVCPLAVLGPMCSAAPVRTGRQLLPSCAPRSPPQVC